ncbi:MAG TPA: hypothetical protein VMR25_01785 [Planctomycetaceae bacterium]|jgi:hypothetical protein|nr:hypothetical protein [Planctomycetaceae bacterium]
MPATRIGALVVIGTALLWAQTAVAQDFHVDTTVEAVTRRETQELTRSVTLFHAGKTYDFIQDLTELVIFDPSHDRFTLLNTRQRRATQVHVDEINRMLQIGRQALAEHVKTLRASGKPDAQTMVDAIVFQFHPQFEESIVQTNRGPLLELKSNYFHYQVLGATPPTPAHGAAYLNYADWIIRLNYVLNPGKTLPEQRIKLDAALRQAQLIPVEVTFGDPNAVQVRARHRIFWDLSERDRELISQWDGLLTRGDLKRVSFQDYQRSLLLSVARGK